MKKLLAILLAFSMLFAFAACGGNTEDESTTTTTEDIFAGLEDEATDDPADDATDAPSEDTSAASEEDSTAASEATSDTSDASAAESTTAAASAGLNSTDAAEVVAYYAAAVKKTGRVTDTEKMALASDITGDGFIGAVLKLAQPIVESVLAEQGGTKERGIPGSDDNIARIKASDVSKAVASSKNGKTTIAIQLKGQVDGPDAVDGKTTGPVARGIGTLGSIDGALEALGATISTGRETVKLTYKNATIKVVVDEKTGKIVDGSWKYDIDIDIANAEIDLQGIAISARNLKAVIAYSVEM